MPSFLSVLSRLAVFSLLTVPLLAEHWQSLGPDGGAVVALARDPADPDVVLAAGEGGFFRSADAGLTWTPAGQGLPALPAIAVAIDPGAPENVWAGTEGAGVYRSADGGETFVASGLELAEIVALLVDPADSDTVFAGLPAGARRTVDGGQSWTSPTGLPAAAITHFAGAADGRIFAASEDGEVFVSTNGGASFSASSNGLDGEAIFGLAADPALAGTLYLATEGGAYLTTDGGAGWDPANSGLTDTALLALGLDPRRLRNRRPLGLVEHRALRRPPKGKRRARLAPPLSSFFTSPSGRG